MNNKKEHNRMIAAQEEEICRLCERFLAHIGRVGGINRFSLKAILREAMLFATTSASSKVDHAKDEQTKQG